MATLLLCALASAAGTVIVVPPGAGQHRMATARLLQEYVQRATGHQFPIQQTPGTGLSIHVGRSAYVDGLGLQLDTLDADGFVRRGVDNANYVIAGPTEYGTEFGVLDFLEQHLGVRWLFPGELGTVVPHVTRLVVPPDEVRSEPVFRSRQCSGLNTQQEQQWAGRLRMRSRVEFHHNLNRMFPPSRYARRYPQIYPVIQGRRYIPASDRDHDWQPDFTQPRLVDEAVAIISEYFAKHPEATSYSLGINDSSRFADNCLVVRSEPLSGRAEPQATASDAYYAWCNAVAERVLAQYPGRTLGCLAYSLVRMPPRTVKLHPGVVVFLTAERLRWVDPGIRATEEQLARAWGQAATRVGWYDYVYGQPYLVPRLYPHVIRDYLGLATTLNVSDYYAELYPSWVSGPQAYVLLKLLWDPSQDVDALLDDWYVACVGPKAAGSLKAALALWEDFWTRGVVGSEWWTRAQFWLEFGSADYLLSVSPELMEQCTNLLAAAVQLAETPEQRNRAQFFADGFARCASAWRAHEPRQLAETAAVQSEQDALAMEARLADALEENGSRMRPAAAGRPTWQFDETFTRATMNEPSWKWHDALLWRLLPWAARSQSVRNRLAGYSGRYAPEVDENVATLLSIASGKVAPITQNPSFENGLAPWTPFTGSNVAPRLEIVPGAGLTGNTALRCSNIHDRGGIMQLAPIAPGEYVAVAHVYVENTAGLRFVAAGAHPRGPGKSVTHRERRAMPVPGEWTTIAWKFTAPAKVDGVATPNTLLLVYASADQPITMLLDDVAIYPVVK